VFTPHAAGRLVRIADADRELHLFEHRRGAARPLGGIGAEHVHEHLIELRRHAQNLGGKRWQGRLFRRGIQVDFVRVLAQIVTCAQRPHSGTHGPQIGPRIEVVEFHAALLGCLISQRAGANGACRTLTNLNRLRDPEVEQPIATGAVAHDVRRLDVEVQNSRAMCHLQRTQQIDEQ